MAKLKISFFFFFNGGVVFHFIDTHTQTHPTYSLVLSPFIWRTLRFSVFFFPLDIHLGVELLDYKVVPGGCNGTPLQYSCLENPMDRGAWWAAVHGVAKSRTQLSNFTFMHWRRKWQPTPVFLPGESQGRGSLVGCRLWARTESDMIEAT